MPSKQQFDVAAVRRLAYDHVSRSSLRAVADEIGMSKSGLDSFIKGRSPYSGTRAKLFVWYVRNRHPETASVAAEEVDAAISLLERYIQGVGSATVRERRVREVADRLFRAEPDERLEGRRRRRAGRED
jgi:hypothetical protein